jgi:hypothetical protein
MLKAKEIQVTLRFTTSDLNIEDKNAKIADLLGNDFTKNIAKFLSKFNLVYTNQLFSKSGNKMISWQQLKLLRGESSKGRKAKWFTKIEEKLLEDKERRLLKADWRTNEPNSLALEVLPKPLSCDKRKKEWVLIKTVEEENTKPVIGKIVTKGPERLLTEHWQEEMQIETAKVTLSKCKGCELNQNQISSSCERWIDKVKVQGEISNYIKKRKQQTLELDQEMINYSQKTREKRVRQNESEATKVACYDLDIEIIKKQHISQLMKEELIKLNQRNKERPDEILIFYTDGLLKRALGKEASTVDQMGSGWVQLDRKEEKILSEDCFGT